MLVTDYLNKSGIGNIIKKLIKRKSIKNKNNGNIVNHQHNGSDVKFGSKKRLSKADVSNALLNVRRKSH